jgi:serine phosphatase RsbU (regulator of sigma subunit)
VSWRALVLAGVDEPQLLPKLQQVLVSERHDDMLFTTVCTVAIHPGRPGELLARLAGHPPPVLLGPQPRPVTPPVGLPLGIARNVVWDPVRVRLDAGWRLLLYTDGLIEGRVPEPGQRLWEEGLLGLLEEERDADLERLPARLVERAQSLNGGPLLDDVAILLLSADVAALDITPTAPAPAASQTARTAP